jgi:hypothetical protein
MGICRAEPIKRLAHERTPLLDTSSDLRREFVKTRCAKSARRRLCGVRQGRRDREMIARVHRDGLAHKFQFAREVIELMTHLGQTIVQAGVTVALLGCVKKAIERGTDQTRFGGSAMLGGCGQSRDEFFADIDADLPLHGAPYGS